MTDHLTAAILAAARLDDAAAVAHLAEHLGAAGYGARKLLREFPVTLPAFLADRPSLRASVERAAGIAFDDQPPDVAVRGATLTTPDDVIPDDIAEWHPYASREEYDAALERGAGIISGAIDVPRERRIVAVARARESIAAGDVTAAVGVLLDHMEAML